MKFDREKSFGYPTLRTFLEGDDLNLLDYPKKTFDPDLKIKLNAESPEILDLEYEVGLRVKTLESLVSKKEAKYHFKVECAATFFSETYHSFENEGEFQLDANQLKDKVEITPFIIAESDVSISSEEFHEDFQGIEFKIKSGSVLAIGRPSEYHISREQFRSVRSIFEFNQNEDVGPGEFTVRTDEPYVIIEVHPSTYEKVRRAEQDTAARIVILNSLYVPVVMHLLYELIRDPELENQQRWANIIVGKCNLKGLDISDENAVALNAQKLLDMPFGRLANSGFRITK